MERDLVDYFPTPLGERFRDRIGDHRLGGKSSPRS